MSRFEPIDGRSELALAGESSIHPLLTKTNSLNGYFEATLGEDGQIDLSAPVSGQIEVPVDSMKSNNALIDREMRNRLNMRRFPKVRAELVSIPRQYGVGRYHAVGDLSFHGVTHRLEGELIVQQVNTQTIEIKGEIHIDVRDFNLNPPKLLMFRVYPNVTATLQFVVSLVNEG